VYPKNLLLYLLEVEMNPVFILIFPKSFEDPNSETLNAESVFRAGLEKVVSAKVIILEFFTGEGSNICDYILLGLNVAEKSLFYASYLNSYLT
jgi:hypothetical protein